MEQPTHINMFVFTHMGIIPVFQKEGKMTVKVQPAQHTKVNLDGKLKTPSSIYATANPICQTTPSLPLSPSLTPPSPDSPCHASHSLQGMRYTETPKCVHESNLYHDNPRTGVRCFVEIDWGGGRGGRDLIQVPAWQLILWLGETAEEDAPRNGHCYSRVLWIVNQLC